MNQKQKCWNKNAVNQGNAINIRIYTFNNSNMVIVIAPNTASHSRVSWYCVNTRIHDSKNAFVDPFKPNNDFTWLLPMVNAAAVVKPTVT